MDIEEELNELFYEKLDIESNLPDWVKNTILSEDNIKYGDIFINIEVIEENKAL